MKRILASLLALSLASCQPSADDGYTFEKAATRIEERPITVITHSSINELKQYYNSQPNHRKLGANEQLHAYTVIRPKVCEMHVVDPKVSYDPVFMGHELTHCLYGEWHPTQNERS